jgi:hypothetical protein
MRRHPGRALARGENFAEANQIWHSPARGHPLCDARAVAVDPAAFAVLCRLARRALALEEGAPAGSTGPVGLGGVDPHTLLETVRRHRVADLLRVHAEELGLPAEVTSTLRSWHDRVRPLLMLQALETTRSVAVLADAGVPALAVKGLALAVLSAGRVDARGAGDVDLLIAPEDLAAAHRALTAAGWSLEEGGRVEPGTWAFRHVNRWGNALTYRGNGAPVDLHWRLEVTPGAYPSARELWSRRVEVSLGTGTVPTLGAADALRHSAGHREGWYLQRTLVDLRRLARVEGALEAPGDPLRPLAVTSLALARETIGLPDTVPASVHAQLDAAPAALLARARAVHGLAALPAFGGGWGSAQSFRNRLAASRRPADLQHAVVALVLPAHAAMPVRARSGWVGLPIAVALRAAALVRGLLRWASGRWGRGRPG